MSPADGSSYAQAGVSFEKADSFLDAMLGWIRQTEDFPGAGFRPLIPNGYYASVLDLGLDQALAITTDGVGSKILVAELAGDYSSVGIDCIAMNVNDLICVGARPLAMVDYLAIQDPPASVGEQLGRSLHEGARQAGISIPGGELAQLPEMIRGAREGEGIDLAGTAVGLVARDEISTGAGLEPGDVLLGIASNGVHSNGFTLVRDVLLKKAGLKLDQHLDELDRTLGAELLRPTAIYVPHLRALREQGLVPKASLHITGGGFLNLLRATTDDVCYVIEEPPEIPPIFRLIQHHGAVSDEEMHRVFNLGVGMVLVVAADRVDATLAALRDQIPGAFRLGRVEAGTGRSVRLPGRGLEGQGSSFRRV